MADSNAEDEQSRERSKSLASLSASRWREKLKEKANKFSRGRSGTEHHDANVSDFLGQSSVPATDSRPSNLGLTIPPADKLDPANYAPVPTVTFGKRKKPKGLRVTFSSLEPDVIGEGGDESEIPSKDVVGTWKGPKPSPRSSSEIPGNKHLDLPPSLASPTHLAPPGPRSPPGLTPDGKEATFRQSFLHRAPTRRPIGGWEQRRQSMNMEEGLVQAHKSEDFDGPQPPNVDAPILAPTPMIAEPSSVAEDSSHVRVAPNSERSSPSPLQEIRSRQQSDASFVAYNPSMPKVAPPLSKSPQNLPVPAPAQPQNNVRGQRAASPNDSGRPMTDTRPMPGPPRKEPSPQRSRSATTAAVANQQSGFIQDLPVHDQDGSTTGQAESEDFYSRVQHLRGVFRLAAEKSVDIENKALEHWLRMSAWWFLRGKAALEKNSRSSRQDANGSNSSKSDQQSQQCYVDLAKAWWAMEDIMPDLVGPHSAASIRNMLDSFDGLDYPHLLGVYHMMQSNMNGFAAFMRRSNLLPPPAVLIQGADPCIWLDYPTLPPGLLSLTANLDPRTLTKRTRRPFFPIFFGDTDRFFSYGRVFGEAEIVSDDGEAEDQQLSCIISIIREKTGSQPDLTIVSQDGQVNLHVQSDPKIGPTWKDVEWKIKAHSIRIRLSRDFQVALRLWDEDFRILWGINDYMRRVEADWKPQEHDELLFDDVISAFHYAGPPQGSGNFPSTPVRNCPVRLFRRQSLQVEGRTHRKIFDGMRLVVMTPPGTKTLSSISRTFGKGMPTLYSNLRGEGDSPALMFSIREKGEKTSLILTFKSTTQRADLHTLIAAVAAQADENPSPDIPLESMWIQNLFEPSSQTPKPYPIASSVAWKSVKVIDRGIMDGTEQKIFSDRLRICSACNLGTVVDLANLGISYLDFVVGLSNHITGLGELQVSLGSKDVSIIKLFRPAQDNLLLSFADNLFPKEEAPGLEQTLQITRATPTARVYKFASLQSK